jgi:FkbM family methyltransferase
MQPIEHAEINYRNLPALSRLKWPRAFKFTISAPSEDHIFKIIKTQSTFYERDLLDEIAIRIPQSRGTVLDVGANIGNHSLFFAAVLNKHVISIEPQQEAINFLELNMRENMAFENNEILRLGMGERPCTAIVSNTEARNLGAAKVSVGQAGAGGESVEVSSIDILCRSKSDLPSVQLIKIDTEGMEDQVLRGAINTISKFRPIIAVEAADTDAFNNIMSILSPFGYKASGPFAWTPTYIFSATPITIFSNVIWLATQFIRRRFVK